MDLLLYNLGGSSAVEKRVRKKQKTVKVNKGEVKKSVSSSTKVVKVQKKQPIQIVSKVKQKTKPASKAVNRVLATKVTPVKVKEPLSKMEQPIELAFHLKIVIFYDTTKEFLSKKSLAIRKKMPGYVYPSRQEMLLDQQAKEKVPSRK